MTASDIRIRPATLDDVPAIAAIYAEAVNFGTASFEIEPPSEAEMSRRFDALRSAGYPYFVAERDGTVLGYAYAGPYRPRIAYRWTVEDSIYLAPDARGLGLGRRLLETLIEACTVKGFRQMVAIIGDSKNTPSIALHTALGFAPTGVFTDTGWKHGRWLDSVMMQLPLGPGASTPPEDI